MNIEVFCGACTAGTCDEEILRDEPEGPEGLFVGIEKEFVLARAVLFIFAFHTFLRAGDFDRQRTIVT